MLREFLGWLTCLGVRVLPCIEIIPVVRKFYIEVKYPNCFFCYLCGDWVDKSRAYWYQDKDEDFGTCNECEEYCDRLMKAVSYVCSSFPTVEEINKAYEDEFAAMGLQEELELNCSQ